MKKSISLFLILFLVIIIPVHPIKKDTKLILDQITRLQEIVKTLEQKVTIISTEFSSMYKKVKIIEEKVSAISKSQADMGQNREKLLLSLQFVKEEINDLKNSLNKINDRLTSIPTGSLLAGDETKQNENSNVSIESPDSIYYTAYSDYIKKNYQLAINGFKQFIKYYPDNALADNSYYWIGECYYTQKMYQEAINTFTELITKYSDGDKIPDATLKKGFALIEMGKQSQGINILKELISKFPLSDEAKLAQQKIKEILE